MCNSEFKEQAWIVLGSVEIFVLLFVTLTFNIMVTKGVETLKEDYRSRENKFLMINSVNLTLRSMFNKATNNGFKT